MAPRGVDGAVGADRQCRLAADSRRRPLVAASTDTRLKDERRVVAGRISAPWRRRWTQACVRGGAGRSARPPRWWEQHHDDPARSHGQSLRVESSAGQPRSPGASEDCSAAWIAERSAAVTRSRHLDLGSRPRAVQRTMISGVRVWVDASSETLGGNRPTRASPAILFTRTGGPKLSPLSRLVARKTSVLPFCVAPQTTATNDPDAATQGVPSARSGTSSATGFVVRRLVCRAARERTRENKTYGEQRERVMYPHERSQTSKSALARQAGTTSAPPQRSLAGMWKGICRIRTGAEVRVARQHVRVVRQIEAFHEEVEPSPAPVGTPDSPEDSG